MIPAPLYKDPIFNGPADPMIIRKESDGLFYLFYTQRRSTQQVEGVSYCYGTAIGVAESRDGHSWHYRGALDLDFEFGHNTFWAPEIVFDPGTGLYHMFVSYIQGVFMDWGGESRIEHYTSQDLFRWHHIGPCSFGTGRVIDPCVIRLPDGTWRMWYKDERQHSVTCFAESPDLYHWEYRGIAAGDQAQEGPNVFFFGGYYWLIADIWDGQAVYRSMDALHFTRQKENILQTFGTRPEDGARGAHADVFVWQGRAFIVYFTHPDESFHPRSVIQMAELKVEGGMLTCDRDAEFDVNWAE